MKKAKILANISNTLVTTFLIILIPATIVGTWSIVVNSSNIQKNTDFRIEAEQTIDSLRVQLKLEKRINTMHRDNIVKEIEQ